MNLIPLATGDTLALDPLIGEAWERRRRRRRRYAFAAALVLAAGLVVYGIFRPGGGAGSPPGAPHASPLAAAQLPSATGWNGGTARIRESSCPRCVQVDSWAATVPYFDMPNDMPHRTMAALGPNDVIILILRSWQPSPPAWTLQRHPLRVTAARTTASFEGNTTRGRVSLWSGTTWRNGSFVSVYMFFGSPRPSGAAIERAQHELDATRFPQWSIRS